MSTCQLGLVKHQDAWRHFYSSLKENVVTVYKLQISLLQHKPWTVNLKQETQPVTFLQTWVVRKLYWEQALEVDMSSENLTDSQLTYFPMTWPWSSHSTYFHFDLFPWKARTLLPYAIARETLYIYNKYYIYYILCI